VTSLAIFDNPTRTPRLSRLAAGIELTPLQTALAATARPDVLSLAMGLPDPCLFPGEEVGEAARQVTSSRNLALQYSLPCEALKEKICAFMALRGVECSPDCVFLTHGAQQAVQLIARLLLDMGSPIVEEEISYPGFQHLIDAFEPVILSVPSDPLTGMDLTALQKILSRPERPAFIYSMPTAHNPLGVTLRPEKRWDLAVLAREYQVPIVEDDPYGVLHYGAQPVPALRAFEENWVYYVGSFSKVLAPSLRIGWIVAPEEHVHALSVIKEGSDLNVSTFSQWVVNEYLERHDIRPHVENLRVAYRERRDAMEAALVSYLHPYAQWRVPDSGVFFWVELSESVNASQLLADCLEQERVAFLPAEACSRGKRKNGMRLNFSRCDSAQITDGVARIGRALARSVGKSKKLAELPYAGRESAC
jgi:2-aminoadipate transaminase